MSRMDLNVAHQGFVDNHSQQRDFTWTQQLGDVRRMEGYRDLAWTASKLRTVASHFKQLKVLLCGDKPPSQLSVGGRLYALQASLQQLSEYYPALAGPPVSH